MRFEMYIPRLGRKDAWVRLLLEADSWVGALKSGLLRLGEDGRTVERALCEVRPNGVFLVRDPQHGRTFLLRETQEQPLAESSSSPPRSRPIATSFAREEPARLAIRPSSPGMTVPGRVVQEEAEAALPTQPPPPSGPRPLPAGPLEILLPRVQEEIDQVRQLGSDLRAAAGHALDVAMRYISAESGSVLYTHVNCHDLYFAAARGPKASEVLTFRVPIGVGIVGFSAAEGTSLAVNDVKRDPRFFSRISEALDYEVSTLMAVPILSQGKVYGAIELINHLGAPTFSEEELRLLSFIGERLAEHLAQVIGG
ncbi:MAG: GAF domain-containing protein [Deltaproteobacteria bacterium]|nr:GAF domain-containing protein [Deltaproteobacteria bacterium]